MAKIKVRAEFADAAPIKGVVVTLVRRKTNKNGIHKYSAKKSCSTTKQPMLPTHWLTDEEFDEALVAPDPMKKVRWFARALAYGAKGRIIYSSLIPIV